MCVRCDIRDRHFNQEGKCPCKSDGDAWFPSRPVAHLKRHISLRHSEFSFRLKIRQRPSSTAVTAAARGLSSNNLVIFIARAHNGCVCVCTGSHLAYADR